MPYAELHARSYFSFLDAASAPEELVERAHTLGYRALAVTDVDGLYGVPRAHLEARRLGLSLIVGAELTVALSDQAASPGPAFAPSGRLVLLALDAGGYARLSRLLSTSRLRHPKGSACARWDEVAHRTHGLALLSGGAGGPIDRALAAGDDAGALAWAARLGEAFGERAHVELTHLLRPGDDARLEALARLARKAGLARVVTQDARYATPDRRPLHDVLRCVRAGTSLDAAGRLLGANGEAHLHTVAELERRFAGYPDALERTAALAARARFSLDELAYRFPAFPTPPGETAFSQLHEFTMRGARERYRPLGARAAAQLARELQVIDHLGLAGYFLIVHDIVNFCREQQILCQGRGSAANSAVCYVLGITAVDPVGMELLFERFLSEERREVPDIDLDIAHARREEVIQYVYRRYGRERVAMANEVITYRARSALRDVGKTLGLSPAQVDAVARAHDHHVEGGQITVAGALGGDAAARADGLAPNAPVVARLLGLAADLEGFPRHLGIHSGGMVIAHGPLGEVVPLENATMAERTVTQWDKDDLAALGILKIDLLGLGMLTVLDGAFRLIEAHEAQQIDLASIPPDDPAVYDLICAADTIGVFQIESRAQMTMLPRLRPRTFYDLVIEVAIIRPGPIQGDLVHPYLRRRQGREPVEFAHPSLEPLLRRTLGVPLFQEQGMKLAIVAAGFTPGEADELRRAMGHKRSHEKLRALDEKLLAGMRAHGLADEAAKKLRDQLAAFADYGFPESHAASFALLVYASAWLKRHHPAAFTCALLAAQPMGFYAPGTIVADAQRHGVPMLPVCARRSAWTPGLERAHGGQLAVRLGLASLQGVGDAARATFTAARQHVPFRSIGDFARRSGLPRAALERLAAADGFAGFGLTRREALWQVTALERAPLPLAPTPPIDPAPLAQMTPHEELVADHIGLGLSLDRHPVGLRRAALDAAGVLRAADLARARGGQRAEVAGVVIVRQRPPTAKGMVFITLEDESGLANLVFTPDVYERLRPLARDQLLLVARGRVERDGGVVNLRVDDLARLADVIQP